MKCRKSAVIAFALCATLFAGACAGQQTGDGGAAVEDPTPEAQEDTAKEEAQEQANSAEEDSSNDPNEPELFRWTKVVQEEELVYTEDNLLDMSLLGTVYTFQEEHPNGTTIDAVGLQLYEPITIDTSYTGRKRVSDVQLAADTELADLGLEEYEGEMVLVTGKCFGAHTAWHLRDLVMLVNEIMIKPDDYEYYEDELFESNVEEDLGYYLDVTTAAEAHELLRGCWFKEVEYGSDGSVTTANDTLGYFEFDGKGGAIWYDVKADVKTSYQSTFYADIPDDVPMYWQTNWYLALTPGEDTVNNKTMYITTRGMYLYLYLYTGYEDQTYTETLYVRNTASAGKKIEMDKTVQREANLFLSNFAEQSCGAFSYDGSFDMETLVDFAFSFARVNTPEKIVEKGDFETLTLKEVNTFMKRYTPFFIPVAETPYVSRDSFHYNETDGRIYHVKPGNEDYNYLAVATGMEQGDGPIRFIDYDIYELDLVEYRAQGIDKQYYEMTAAEARSNPALKQVCSGRAVAEAITTPERESFRMISNENVYTVKDVKGFFEAVGSSRTIALEAGTYNVTEHDDEALITECHGLTILPAPGAENKVEMVSSDGYDNVLGFVDCRDITVRGIRFGHILEEAECSANVLWLNNCYDFTLEDLDLYGCGTYAYEAYNSGVIVMKNCVVHDCTYGCVSAIDCHGLTFEDTVFRDCNGYTMLETRNANASFVRCKFYRLTTSFLMDDYEYGYLYFEDCLYDKEILTQLENHPQLMEHVSVMP